VQVLLRSFYLSSTVQYSHLGSLLALAYVLTNPSEV
jgi:hypothetical protein